MSVNVEFELRLKDMMSGILPKVEAAARRAFGGVDDAVGNSQKHFDGLGKSIEGVSEKMRGLQAASAMFFGSLAERGVERVFDFLKEQIGSVLGGGMMEGKVQTMMKVIRPAGGEELYEQTHANLLKSMYGTQLFSDAKALAATGESNKNIDKRLKQFEDLAGGEAGNMEQLIDTYIRVKGSGRLNIREIEPLLGMGFDPLHELDLMHGGGKQKWHKALEDPTKGLQLFEAALDHATGPGGMFDHMQQRLMDTTPFGKKTMLETNIEATKAELGKNPIIARAEMRLFDKLEQIVDNLSRPENMERMATAIGGVIDRVTDFADWAANNTDKIKGWFSELKTGIEMVLGYKALKLGVGLVGNVGSAALSGSRMLGGLAGGEVAAAGMAGAIGEGVAAGIGGSALLAGAVVIGGALLVKLLADDVEKLSNHGMTKADIEQKHDRENGKHWTTKRYNGPAGSGMHEAVKPVRDMLTPDEQRKLDKIMARPYKDGVAKNNAYWTEIDLLKKERANALDKKGKNDVAADVSDAIVGGGAKKIDIHIKSFAEHFEVHANGLKDAAVQSKEVFMRMFLETVQSANAAM